MVTLMTWGNSDGIQGRCDAKCHNAKTRKCECMCGGRYHGKGLQPGDLVEAVKEYGAEIESAARRKAQELGLDISFVKDLPAEQMPLFKSLVGAK